MEKEYSIEELEKQKYKLELKIIKKKEIQEEFFSTDCEIKKIMYKVGLKFVHPTTAEKIARDSYAELKVYIQQKSEHKIYVRNEYTDIEWISCAEHPPKHERVLVYCKNHHDEVKFYRWGHINDEGKWWDQGIVPLYWCEYDYPAKPFQ